ncbi:MAG: efflux RND transporter permease subunit [Gammaproteobacteria bacterium]
MNLTRVAIENNRTTWVLLIVMLVAGVSAYYQLPRDYDPGFLVRMAQVVTTFPGASPERVEQLVTDKLEKVIQEIPELDSVVSESRTGISIIKVNIQERYTDLRPIWDNLRRKIDAEAKNLPEGVVGPFVNDEFGDVFGIVLSVTGEGFDFAEMKTIADDVRDALLRLPQTSKVELFGNQDEQIFVDFDPVRLSEMGLTPFHLMQTLSGRNVVVPGGAIYVADERIVLEPSGNYENLEAIQRTLIEVPGKSSLIYLGDIAEVHRGYVEPVRSAVHASGAPALAIAVSMRKGGNIIALGESVARTVQQLTEQYPIGIEIQNVLFSPHEVDRKVQAFVVNLMQAIAVVAAVMLLSLGMRTGLVVAALIPSSMIMALLVMSFFHIGLNQISLAALMIALGMLVDNGIVMTENIVVKMKSGQSPLDAAIGSATELRVPLLTASLTTAAAFLPIYLAQSNTGEYTAPLFEVVSITLLSSWVLSMTVIPMLCVYCLKVKVAPASAHQGGADVSRDEGACLQDRVLEKYRSVLVVLLRHRVAMVIATVLVFGFHHLIPCCSLV